MNPNNPQQVFYHQQQPVPPVIQQQQQPLSQQQQPVMINNTIPPHIMQQQQQQPSTFSAPNPSSLHVRSVDINFSRAINEFNKIEIDNSLFSFQNEFASDEIQEPINRCKELFPLLKASIQNLMIQLSNILSPSNESIRNLNENQFLIFGKNVESFNKICDLLNVCLKAGYESQMMANDLRQFYRYYSHIDVTDANRNDSQILNSVNIQAMRVNDLKTLLNRFTN